MDATIQGLRLPEGFAGMLEDNGLPLPPLPLEAINELEQTDEWFFATDGREPLSVGGRMERSRNGTPVP